MNLREQMAVDACAILNTDELGEQALWTPYGQTSGLNRTVRLIEQPDLQTIRRAYIWTIQNGTATRQGDLFRVKRGNITSTWRVLYTDPAETALQRLHCHLQLTDTIKAVRRPKYKRASGADASIQSEVAASYRCQWFESSAEIDVESKRRSMQGEWYCVVEEVPELDTDLTLTDSNGRSFRVDRLEKGFNRDELPYLICSRSDV